MSSPQFGAEGLIELSIEGGIAFLLLDNPPLNLLSKDLLLGLKNTIKRLEADSKVKVIIITGKGKFFGAGADIKELSAIKTKREGERFARMGQEILNLIESLEKPVIAAINGPCIGGSNELAMACHLRIASEEAWFSQPEISLGIIPGFGGTQRLPGLVGKARAMETILTGGRIASLDAFAIGLVNKVVKGNELIKEAKALAAIIGSKGMAAVKACLEAVNSGMDTSLKKGLDKEARLFGALCETEDKKEGISAFVEKRSPRFKDR
ncbi:MAG: enoyl-CoA hydratase/isomerase family protein [Nitrospinae bacterium]|nr:enoyl-CoA hydratase/isomerase family protein [Nitrospinota bacterium]MBI3814606.1 enoyl-CoA hydratase/isomerase family protein [Nitrospinota bacterium]